MKFKVLTLFIFIFSLVSCEKIAILTTPKKTAVKSQSPLALEAEKNFWDTLHQGQYKHLPETIRLLTAAYLENPNDPQLAAHLGFSHIWKITERERDPSLAKDPRIVNEIILARKYFADSTELDPHDARFQGFLADSTLIEGQIFKDQEEQVHGYFQLKHAINMWPEFNYFTGGYIMSSLDPQSKEFKEGLEWQWKTLNLCAGTRIDRNNPDFSPYLSRETQQGSLRACWNSWIAPHNFEGFFLNMGDMLVKKGDWQTAGKIYKNAKLSKTYSSWPYHQLLEKRIQNAKANVAYFQKTDKHPLPEHTILFNSGYGCVACHQKI